MQGPTTVSCGAAPLRPCPSVCGPPTRARGGSIRVRYDLWPHRVATYRSVQPARRAEVSARALAFAWACACLICGFMWLAQRAMLAAVGNARYYLPEGLQMPLEHTLVSDEGGYRGLDSQQVERLPLADCV